MIGDVIRYNRIIAFRVQKMIYAGADVQPYQQNKAYFFDHILI